MTGPGPAGLGNRFRACLVALLAAAGVACQADPGSSARSTLTLLRNGDDLLEVRLYSTKYLLFLPLVHGDLSDLQPRLAESWEHSDDYRTWTIYLREGVRWHDGVPVTAHDIAFSLELFAHPDVQFTARMWGLESIDIVDDYTLTIHLSYAGDPRSAWPVYFPKHLLEDLDPADFGEWDFWKAPVGNGPYRFVRRVPQTAIELEANPDFYAGKPAIERIFVRFSSGSPLVELRSRGADVAFDLAPADVLALRSDPEITVHHQSQWDEVYLIYWNHRHPLLSEPTVRLALTHAIDRRELASVQAFPDHVPFLGGLGNDGGADPEGRRGWDRVVPHDPDLARRLLAEAGWIDRDGDGVREKDGLPARFTLLASGDATGGVSQALLIQRHLSRVGVDVRIRPVESSGLVREAVRAGDFDAATTWVDQDPDTILQRWLGGPAALSETADLTGPFGWHDVEAARLLDSLRDIGDPAIRDTLYRRLNEILRRDMPVTLLYPGVYNFAAHRRIGGFRDRWPSGLTYAEELFIREP